jgi:hypothetical protein
MFPIILQQRKNCLICHVKHSSKTVLYDFKLSASIWVKSCEFSPDLRLDLLPLHLEFENTEIVWVGMIFLIKCLETYPKYLVLDAKLLRRVFTKCGASDMKNIRLSSFAYKFNALKESFPVHICASFMFVAALSLVAAITWIKEILHL